MEEGSLGVEAEPSDLWWVRMRTCSTVSSSAAVVARLDQHSKAAAIVGLG